MRSARAVSVVCARAQCDRHRKRAGAGLLDVERSRVLPPCSACAVVSSCRVLRRRIFIEDHASGAYPWRPRSSTNGSPPFRCVLRPNHRVHRLHLVVAMATACIAANVSRVQGHVPRCDKRTRRGSLPRVPIRRYVLVVVLRAAERLGTQKARLPRMRHRSIP